MRIVHKTLLMPLLAGLAFLLIFTITWSTAHRSGALLEQIEERFFPSVELAHQMEMAAVQARHALLDAVTVADEEMILLAREQAQRYSKLLKDARKLASFEEEQLDALELAFRGWFEHAAETSRDLIHQDFSPELLDAVALMNSDYEVLMMELSGATENQQLEMEAALARARRDHLTSRNVVSGATLLSLLLILGIGAFVISSIMRPLRVLISGTEEIATGNLHARIDYYAPDEMGRLAESFRHMQESLIADIARREEVEEKLRSSSERLRAILESTSIGVSIASPDGYFSGSNEAWQRMLGRSDEELRQLRVREVTHPDDREESGRLFGQVVSGALPQYQHEKRYLRPDGSWFWGDLSVTPLREADGSIGGVLGMILDITDRKRAEEALRNSEEKYRTLVQNARSIILRWSTDGTIRVMNEYGRELFGYREEEIVGSNLLDTIVPATESSGRDLREMIAQMGRQQEGFESNENEMLTRSGERLWVSWANSPLLDEEGNVEEVLSVGLDVTDRKQAEDELRAAQKKLVENAHLAGMAEIATNVLHNVGNVLTSATTATTVLRGTLKSSKVNSLERLAQRVGEHEQDLVRFLSEDPQGSRLPAFLAQLSEVIRNEQERISGEVATLEKSHEHIRQIIALQQSYAGVSGPRETIALAELVGDAVQLFGASFERHHIELEILEPGGPVEALLDKHRVLQIVINLLKNARDAVKQSDQGERRITVTLESTPRELRLRVDDTGHGIEHGDLERIFTYGYSTKQKGHGYGLHGSANAAREMGGSLTVRSDGTGRGASFLLTLPLAQQSEKKP